jgi:ATP phosphoribosyltransferase regulatory subunit HisZ
VLDVARARADAVAAAQVHELLEPAVAERVIFDLGLVALARLLHGRGVRGLRPALGAPIGGGGRYDDLLGRFGRDLPAVGWALNVERLHIALVGERAR